MTRPRLVLGVLFLAVGALLAGQVLADYRNRADLSDAQRRACVRGLFDRADAIEADLDSARARREEARFRRDAAAARDHSGDHRVAESYRIAARRAQLSAASARARARRREARLLGADVEALAQVQPDGRPTRGAVHVAAAVCARVVPEPSLIP